MGQAFGDENEAVSRAVTLPEGHAIDAGKRVRVRRLGKPAMTRAQEETFFATLAQSCNVSMAARAAGVRPQRVYERRQRCASFAKAWGEAIAQGYQRLELALLERALVGSEKITVDAKGGETRVRDYPNNIALALLKMHREAAMEAEERAAGRGIDEAEVEEARARILARLDRLADKLAEKDRQGGDTPTEEG